MGEGEMPTLVFSVCVGQNSRTSSSRTTQAPYCPLFYRGWRDCLTVLFDKAAAPPLLPSCKFVIDVYSPEVVVISRGPPTRPDTDM